MPDELFTPDVNNLEQQALLQLLNESQDSIFLTGKAGTGKSTLLRYIHSTIKKEHVLLASTGIAALNIGGQTIHSFFKLPLRPILPDDSDLQKSNIYDKFRYSKEHVKLLQSLQLIIIDEISMVRADVIDAMDKLLRVYRRREYLPFGGVQMLFVGDLFQLEPVVRPEERTILGTVYSSPFFYDAKVFRTGQPDRAYLLGVELQKVYRQGEKSFVDILDHVRSGAPKNSDLEALNKRVDRSYRADTDSLAVTLAPTRKQVAYINEERLKLIKGQTYHIEGMIEGEFPDTNLPTEKVLTLKVGAQVMLLTNDRDKRWANGTIAVIEKIDLENKKIRVRLEDGSTHNIEPNIWENIRYTYNEKERKIESETIGIFTQYPLRLAWAITIHKSQGLTFDNVIIDLNDRAFAGGQVYVALSRCRSLEGITLTNRINMRDIIARTEVANYYKQMNDAKQLSDAFERAKSARYYIDANISWKRGRYSDAISSLHAAIAGNNLLSNPAYLRLLCLRLSRIEQMDAELRSLRKELEGGRQKLRSLAEEHVHLGDECLTEAHDPEAALRCYAKAIDFDIRSLDARLGQAKAYRMLNRREEAIATLLEAQALSPLHPTVLYQLGGAYVRYGMYEESLEPLARLIGQDKAHVPAIELIIKAYSRLGDDERAEQFELLLEQAKRKRTDE